MMSSASAARARALVVVSRFNESVTRKLLRGALGALATGGYPENAVDVVWVPGAMELPLVLQQRLETERYALAVALGAVIRGDTPHFDVVIDTCARGIGEVGLRTGLPIGFGVLTCESLNQALDRAGGAHGNKGAQAAQAAIETLEVLRTPDSSG